MGGGGGLLVGGGGVNMRTDDACDYTLELHEHRRVCTES